MANNGDIVYDENGRYIYDETFDPNYFPDRVEDQEVQNRPDTNTLKELPRKEKIKLTPQERGKKLAELNKQRKAQGIEKKKRRNLSAKSGVLFPVNYILKNMKKMFPDRIISKEGGIYMSSVLEYLCSEILDLSGDIALKSKKKRIIPRYIQLAINNDEELHHLLNNVIIAQGGVTPHIHPQLLHTKSRGYRKTSTGDTEAEEEQRTSPKHKKERKTDVKKRITRQKTPTKETISEEEEEASPKRKSANEEDETDEQQQKSPKRSRISLTEHGSQSENLMQEITRVVNDSSQTEPINLQPSVLLAVDQHTNKTSAENIPSEKTIEEIPSAQIGHIQTDENFDGTPGFHLDRESTPLPSQENPFEEEEEDSSETENEVDEIDDKQVHDKDELQRLDKGLVDKELDEESNVKPNKEIELVETDDESSENSVFEESSAQDEESIESSQSGIEELHKDQEEIKLDRQPLEIPIERENSLQTEKKKGFINFESYLNIHASSEDFIDTLLSNKSIPSTPLSNISMPYILRPIENNIMITDRKIIPNVSFDKSRRKSSTQNSENF
ncbi:unnamed protein product [Brachionus calyciflorus]|uniref:Histone H2A n=1 Tax=Brachionus calyciflorus TaxID=104777 RepID=A0A813M8W9_9BILA|nr:unnamed protein product [Brachionus calyciflorus]